MNPAITQISNAIHDTAGDKLARIKAAKRVAEKRIERFEDIINDMEFLLGRAKTAVRYRNNLPYIEGQLEWVNECLDPALAESGGSFEVPNAMLELYKELLTTILKTQSMAV